MPIVSTALFFHAVYRAQFPQTFKEIKTSTSDYKIVAPAVLVGCLFAAWLASFLRRTGESITLGLHCWHGNMTILVYRQTCYILVASGVYLHALLASVKARRLGTRLLLA